MLCLEIPNKTFVIGEYLALEGTASMLLSTEPCFKIKIQDGLSSEIQTDKSKKIDHSFVEFHPDSPGGRLCQKLKQKKKYFIEDPHEGGGGFGCSTAEYLSVLIHDLVLNKKKIKLNPSGLNFQDLSTIEKTKKSSTINGTRNLREKFFEEDLSVPKTDPYKTKGELNEFLLKNLDSLIPDYQSCVSNYKPSGADLVAQICGGLCWYDGMNFSCERLAWPFPGYEIYVFKTGYKQKTHEHLKNIKSKNFKILIPPLMSARLSIEQANLKVFCRSINDYYDILGGLGLSDSKVQTCVYRLREEPEILAAKACGAMGMDTVLVVARLSDEDKIEKLGQEQGFTLVSQLKQSHSGACYSLY